MGEDSPIKIEDTACEQIHDHINKSPGFPKPNIRILGIRRLRFSS